MSLHICQVTAFVALGSLALVTVAHAQDAQEQPSVVVTPPAAAPPAAASMPPTNPEPLARVQLKVAPSEAHPCEPDEEDRDAEGMGVLMLGMGVFDVSALNKRLEANGYERIPSALPLIGGEGRAVMRSGFVAGVRGAAILAPSGDGPNGLRRHYGGGFGMLDFGFALVRSQPLLVTLTGGIGGYGLSLGISDEQSARFDDILANPQRSSSVSRGGLLVGLGLGIDGRVPVGRVERKRRGFFDLGARIGALYGPALGSWGLSEGGNASAGPSLGLAGVYGALVIGFGGGREPRL